MTRITATVPLSRTPAWAVLERHLFDVLDGAWREFGRIYCEPDGRLRYAGPMHDRDGVDDFYEPFFNWPVLYRLGGSDDVLTASKHHWEGVTAQMTEFGFVRDEFELGYDWFHQGESMIFFYAICAADPGDALFRDRAIRFAELYLPGSASGNYDAATRTIVAPHTGSGGPRWGLGEDWREYRADQLGMERYGLPLMDLDGIRSWSDLADPSNARRMGDAMQQRLGRGDTAVNLAATSLVTNAWLYDHDEVKRDWVLDYVGAWRERAAAHGGLLPDNAGESGVVGEAHGGAWYGGHYGWTWPHGFYSIEPAVMTGTINESIVSSAPSSFDLARVPLDTVISEGHLGTDVSTAGSLGWGWAQMMGVDDRARLLLVPYRHGPSGWFDFHPVPLIYPLWLWWLTGSEADLSRLESLEEVAGFDWTQTRFFHNKEEQGHEAPWFSYLRGRNPGYPEDALLLALAQVDRRLALMRLTPFGPPDDDIHWWQRLNPVVTEVLMQLTTGSPPALYNGGLSLARVIYGDGLRGRPGLPDEVAALVSEVGVEGIRVEFVNLGTSPRQVVVQAGALGEDRIDRASWNRIAADYPGDSRDYRLDEPAVAVDGVDVGSCRLTIDLPPLTTITLRLQITRRAYTASHTHFTPQNREPHSC